ncbi:hypothetical protein [Kluyvera intermedia]|uniref:hypothetical protein n=1 Tax=Kluyvera intermedia TaxID=61648 RepID=UPI003BA091A6
MAGKTLIIPFESNEVYYGGIRGVLSSIVYSMVGVYIVGLMTSPFVFEQFFEMPMLAVTLWIFLCGFIWLLSYFIPDRVLWATGRGWHCAVLAKVCLALLYILIGVLCSLIFDAITKGTTPDYLYTLLVGFLIILRLFCLFSVKEY